MNNNHNQTLIAIDPGLHGAIAVLHPDGSITADPMPLAGKELDLVAISEQVETANPAWIVIEKVGSMPGQGVASTFKFGRGYGSLLGKIGRAHV